MTYPSSGGVISRRMPTRHPRIALLGTSLAVAALAMAAFERDCAGCWPLRSSVMLWLARPSQIRAQPARDFRASGLVRDQRFSYAGHVPFRAAR